MTTKILDLDNIERKLFWALTALLAVCVAMYLYSVLSLTVSVVERDRMSRTMHEVSTKAGDMDREYITLQNGVTLEYAHRLGFQDVAAKFTGATSAASAVGVSDKISMAR